MVMEEEVPMLLKIGFGTILTVAIMVIIMLWVKNRNNGYGWLFAHLLFFSGALVGAFKVLDTRGDLTASSADNSLMLAGSRFLWATGMVCFLVGVMLLQREKMT